MYLSYEDHEQSFLKLKHQNILLIENNIVSRVYNRGRHTSL